MITAIIPAAGSGERFKKSATDLPKQFSTVANQPLYSWSLNTFARCSQISAILLVVPQDRLMYIEEELSRSDLFKGVKVTAGGATRQESVRLGLEYLNREKVTPEYVLVHDAARPMVSEKMIAESIEAVIKFGACTLAIPVSDTLKKAESGTVSSTIDRDSLVHIQTPQAARFDWFLEAHRKAAADKLGTTDDSTILQHSGHSVYIVPGSPYNLKITNPEDLWICHSLLSAIQSGGLQAAI